MKYMAPCSLMIVALFAFTLTGCSSSSKEPLSSDTPGDAHAVHADAPQLWTCSMHPQIQSPESGKCSICSMDLIPVAETAGGMDTLDNGHGGHDHGEHAHDQDGGQTDMEKMKAQLAKLSPEDAASAERQHICPVSGEMLGTMGAPEKVDVDGQPVWICCDGCKDRLLESPEEYLATLNNE